MVSRYKQQGREAVAAHNVFFYSSYAGTVDADRISNPVTPRLENEVQTPKYSQFLQTAKYVIPKGLGIFVVLLGLS